MYHYIKQSSPHKYILIPARAEPYIPTIIKMNSLQSPKTSWSECLNFVI